MNTFDNWEAGLCLAHHGIKGQKWGVRRFQNEDGTLTDAGKARVAKGNSGYLNPDRKDQKKGRSAERDKVSKKYTDEYWRSVKKGMSTHDPSDEDQRLWDKYKDKYASATLKDMKLKDTKRARDSVKAVLKAIDISYDYNGMDKKLWNASPDEIRKYEEGFVTRRKEISHPVRTKIKRKAKKAAHYAKSAIDTAANVKKIFG